MHTWTRCRHNVCHIGQEYAALELQTWLALGCDRKLFLATHVFRFLFARIDIFAANQDPLEEVDVVLFVSVTGFTAT